MTPEVLHAHGIVRKDAFVKILARGEITAQGRRACPRRVEGCPSRHRSRRWFGHPDQLPFKAEGKAGRPAAKGNQFTNR